MYLLILLDGLWCSLVHSASRLKMTIVSLNCIIYVLMIWLTSIKYFSALRFQTRISPFPLPSLFLPIVFKKLLGSVPPIELYYIIKIRLVRISKVCTFSHKSTNPPNNNNMLGTQFLSKINLIHLPLIINLLRILPTLILKLQ